ncbi:MAG: hypothetical protein B7Z37_02470 [Verrucomicrobia bacterium 12-59-8]|nr:MAG: hypothetical protein B7Z37_02470 [Verrucomicrobia bacterium 12-59-8]
MCLLPLEEKSKSGTSLSGCDSFHYGVKPYPAGQAGLSCILASRQFMNPPPHQSSKAARNRSREAV